MFSQPYFYVDTSDVRKNIEVMNFAQKKFEGCTAEEVEREDLDMPNHLSGKKHKFVKLSFKSAAQLGDAKAVIRPILALNKKKKGGEDEIFVDPSRGGASGMQRSKDTAVKASDPLEYIIEMREHDLSYSMRVAIDKDIRVGAWYLVSSIQGSIECNVVRQHNLLERCEPRILAFDIECEKAPLKFPNADNDRIYMISYMAAGQGFLIINRDIVSADVNDFEYTPLPKYPGPFNIFNEKTEEAMLRKFVSHIQELRPHVISSLFHANLNKSYAVAAPFISGYGHV